MPHISAKHYLTLAGGLAIIAVLITAYSLLRPVSPPSPRPAPVVAVPVDTRGGRGDSAQAALPTNFPLPTGTVTGTIATPTSWSIGLNIDGNYTTVMPAIRDFYVSHDFTDLNPGQTIPIGFRNTNYSFQVVGRNHDHSGPLSTDITIVVHKN